jgi:hypothetical protein
MMRACGSQARTPATALTPSRHHAPFADILVRWSGGSGSQAPANSTTTTRKPNQSPIIAPSRSAECGRIANSPA